MTVDRGAVEVDASVDVVRESVRADGPRQVEFAAGIPAVCASRRIVPPKTPMLSGLL
ncbi:hypothetical protein [Streptomyces sp. NPDC005009]